MQSIFGVDVNLIPGNEPAEPENERRKTYGLKDERISLKRNMGLELSIVTLNCPFMLVFI